MNNLKQIISSLFVYTNGNNNNSQTINNISIRNDNCKSQTFLPKLNMNTYLDKLSRLKETKSQDYIMKNILFIKEKEAQLKTKKFANNQSLDHINIHYRNKIYKGIPSKVYDRV